MKKDLKVFYLFQFGTFGNMLIIKRYFKNLI